jgi:hypothetical protein
MSFCRTLLCTIMVAIFGAVVLAPGDAAGAQPAVGTSINAFAIVFLAAAGALMIALLGLLLIEEKPLQDAMPAAKRS